jgi:hypothetical protein
MASPVGLPVPNPTRSFWIDAPVANSLETEGGLCPNVDICIIGSGITGVSAAYHLAGLFALEGDDASSNRIPIKAVILEAREFCEHCLQTLYLLPLLSKSFRLWSDRSVLLVSKFL